MRRIWAWWDWLKWTPALLLIVLIAVGFLVPDDNSLWVISYIWLAVGLTSTTFAALLLSKTHRIRCIAITELPQDDPFRILMEIQHYVAVLTLVTHLLFTSVGLSVIFLPNEVWRQTMSRASLVDAQFVLFLIVALTYMAVLLVMRKMREQVNHDQLDPKSKALFDKDLRRDN